MEKQYIEQRNEGYWVAGTRVSLDSIVFAFIDGLPPETIVAECFPVLTLEQADAEFETLRQQTNEPAFSKKMAEVRRQMHMSHS